MSDNDGVDEQYRILNTILPDEEGPAFDPVGVREDRYHILTEDNELEQVDILEWGEWLREHPERKVLQKTLFDNGPTVSTVLLGLDHSIRPEDPPQLFETMVFEEGLKEIPEYTERYATYDEAMEGHFEVADQVAHNTQNDEHVSLSGEEWADALEDHDEVTFDILNDGG